MIADADFSLFVSTIRMPDTFLKYEAGCIVVGLGGSSMIDGGGDFSSLK